MFTSSPQLWDFPRETIIKPFIPQEVPHELQLEEMQILLLT